MNKTLLGDYAHPQKTCFGHCFFFNKFGSWKTPKYKEVTCSNNAPHRSSGLVTIVTVVTSLLKALEESKKLE